MVLFLTPSNALVTAKTKTMAHRTLTGKPSDSPCKDANGRQLKQNDQVYYKGKRFVAKTSAGQGRIKGINPEDFKEKTFFADKCQLWKRGDHEFEIDYEEDDYDNDSSLSGSNLLTPPRRGGTQAEEISPIAPRRLSRNSPTQQSPAGWSRSNRSASEQLGDNMSGLNVSNRRRPQRAQASELSYQRNAFAGNENDTDEEILSNSGQVVDDLKARKARLMEMKKKCSSEIHRLTRAINNLTVDDDEGSAGGSQNTTLQEESDDDEDLDGDGQAVVNTNMFQGLPPQPPNQFFSDD